MMYVAVATVRQRKYAPVVVKQRWEPSSSLRCFPIFSFSTEIYTLKKQNVALQSETTLDRATRASSMWTLSTRPRDFERRYAPHFTLNLDDSPRVALLSLTTRTFWTSYYTYNHTSYSDPTERLSHAFADRFRRAGFLASTLYENDDRIKPRQQTREVERIKLKYIWRAIFVVLTIAELASRARLKDPDLYFVSEQNRRPAVS